MTRKHPLYRSRVLPLLAVALSPLAAVTPAAAQSVPNVPAAPAAVADPDPVLIANSVAEVRRSDYELELTRLPPDVRAGFSNNKRRIQELLSKLLLTKTLAAQARAAKLEQDPEFAARLKIETEKFVAAGRIAALERDAAREFDAKKGSLEPRARELYFVNLKRYTLPERVSVSHILFASAKHPKDEAQKLAADTRARIAAGEDFNAVAVAVSEDGSARQNRGKIDYFVREEVDPAFGAAAFNLRNVGDVSEPVQSQFGWHVIRLDGRTPGGPRPYEEVREQIYNEMKQSYVTERREALINAINTDPSTRANEAAVDALHVRAPEPPKPELPAASGEPRRTYTPEERAQFRAKRLSEKEGKTPPAKN